MSVGKNSIKQRIKTAIDELQIFTRPELYQRIQNLFGKNIPCATMKREFTYLLQMGYIKATEKTKNNFKIYKRVKNTSTIQNFFN